MASNVSIALKSTGVSEVLNALKGVKQTLIELEKDSLNSVRNSSKARLDILKSEYRERENLARRMAEVESKLGRGFGGGGSTRPSLVGGGGFGAIGRIGQFGANEFGLGGLFRLGSAAGVAGAAVGAMFMALKAGIDLATSALKAFGSFVLNDIIKPELGLEARYNQLSAKSAELGGRGLSPADARRAAEDAFVRFNLSKEEGVKAMEVYGAHGGEGSWKDAPKVLRLAAQEALIRGGEASTYAQVIAGLRVKGESVDETIAKYLAVRRQGDIIDVPVEELQNRGKQIKAASLFMGGSTSEKFAATNVLVQKASSWTADPASAITGLNRFTSDIMVSSKGVAHRKYRKFLGRDENGQEVITDVAGLLGQVLADTKGTPGKLPGLGFKDVRSQRFIESFTPEFNNFKKQAQGEGLTDPKKINQRAAELFADSLRQLMKETDTLASIEKEAGDRMRDSGASIENSFNQVKEVLSGQFMPVVKKAIEDLGPMFEELADYLEDNSEGIGEALETLRKVFTIAAKGMEYELIGMIQVLTFVVNKLKYVVPGLAPIADAFENANNGKGILDTIYNGVTGRDENGNPTSSRIPRRLRKKGIVTVGEFTYGAPPIDINEPIPNNIGEEPASKSDKTIGENQKLDMSKLNEEAKQTATLMDALKKQIQDLTNNLSRLNRTESFVERPGRRF